MLDQSDFLTPFLDLALPDLVSMSSSKISASKMRSLLEVVLGNPASVSASDIYKDDLDIEFGNANLFDQMERINSVRGGDIPTAPPTSSKVVKKTSDSVKGTYALIFFLQTLGIDSFHLAYRVNFPLSIILSQGVIVKYQLIFRFLFLCKYLDYRLSSGWVGQSWSRPRGAPPRKRKSTPPSGSLTPKRSGMNLTSTGGKVSAASSPVSVRRAASTSALGGGGFSLQHPQIATLNEFKPRLCMLNTRMHTFIKELIYFACYEVVEPHWADFLKDMSANSSSGDGAVQDVISRQHAFLDTCIRECMLSNTKLLKVWRYRVPLTTHTHTQTRRCKSLWL